MPALSLQGPVALQARVSSATSNRGQLALPAASRPALLAGGRGGAALRSARGRGSLVVRAAGGDDNLDSEIEMMLGNKAAMTTRPAKGFGVSSKGDLVEYNTAIEDELMKELELEEKVAANKASGAASKAAKVQAAARDGGEPGVGAVRNTDAGRALDELRGGGADQAGPPPEVAGPRVWVGGLPRKRNVRKDLGRVFGNGTDGLLAIYPAESRTNAKTREGICKGFAFFVFASKKHASNFIDRNQGVTVQFGKVSKSLKLRMVTDEPSSPLYDRREGGGAGLGGGGRGGRSNNAVPTRRAAAVDRE